MIKHFLGVFIATSALVSTFGMVGATSSQAATGASGQVAVLADQYYEIRSQLNQRWHSGLHCYAAS